MFVPRLNFTIVQSQDSNPERWALNRGLFRSWLLRLKSLDQLPLSPGACYKNAASQAPPETYWIRLSVLTDPTGNWYVCQSMWNTDFEHTAFLLSQDGTLRCFYFPERKSHCFSLLIKVLHAPVMKFTQYRNIYLKWKGMNIVVYKYPSKHLPLAHTHTLLQKSDGILNTIL